MNVTRQTRRSWMQSTASGIATLSAASYLKAAEANKRVRAAVVGLGAQGYVHVKSWKELANAELVYVCDVDASRIANVTNSNPEVKPVNDLRRILDDPSIDAVSIATPDHWHVPAALLALEAGKHVYLEKPCAHNLREGRAIVDAARKHNRIVQHGTQSRSSSFIKSAVDLIRDGIIGDLLVAKAWDVQRRRSIGRQQPSTPPAGVDYDTWLGPALEVPFQANRFHYDWRWWRNFGTGDMGNDGVHEIDIACWGLGINGLPSRVTSIGGKYFFDDDQEFPDTQTAILEYSDDARAGQKRQLIFELRLWSSNFPHNVDGGCTFHGTKGQMTLSKRGKIQVLGADNRPISKEMPQFTKLTVADHLANFVGAIREGTPLNADIEVGYHSTAVCHLSNLSALLGRSLEIDPAKEQITGDEEANRLLGREYRSHWATPQQLA